MKYAEEDYLMLSGIQHFQFCRRQWALIYIEQQWDENLRTIEGEIFHSNAHNDNFIEKRNNIIIIRGMRVFSHTLGVHGVCDIVEFVRDDHNGVSIHGREGKYMIEPVEYKKGKPKCDQSDILQVVAQAMCLEEMLVCEINKAYIFYGETKRRETIVITEELRKLVTEMCTSALESVGLDPYVGFMHTIRPGRKSLALDLVEELRSVFADRFVITLINKKMILRKHFIEQEDGAVLLNDEGKKIFFKYWQQKKLEIIEHPYLKEKVEWGIVLYVQALLLSHYLRGDLDSYPAFFWK